MSGLLDAYDTETTLDVMQAAPLAPEPQTKRSAWTAPVRGVAAAGSELFGNLMDISGAAGKVMATAGAGPGQFMLPDAEQKKLQKQSREAFEDVQRDGLDFRNPGAAPVYDYAQSLRPDPITAGAAEQVVFGVTKGLTKAIGTGVALGPMGGAGVFGVSEGMTTAEDLARQGVDKSTRTQAGLVHGAVSAVSVALPAAGQTIKQTAALVLAGGPLAFVAENTALKTILENADYGEIAEQYDPLDPVGLTVATLLPAGFGAWAMRGKFKSAPQADTTPGAVIETASGPMKPTHDDLDAAMVHNLTLARDAHEDAARQIVDQAPAEEPRLAPEQPDIQPSAKPTEPVDTAANDATADPIAQSVDTIRTEQPDLPVMVNEDGSQVTAAKHLDDVRKAAQEGLDDELGALDAPLLKVAAECFLSAA